MLALTRATWHHIPKDGTLHGLNLLEISLPEKSLKKLGITSINKY
jgi:hypothetical protein